MAAFDPLDWLISRNVERARRAAYITLCLGALTLLVFVYWMIQIPWQVTASSTVVAEGARCGVSGAVYFISVNGRHYECEGGDTKCPIHEDGPVAYDPERPSKLPSREERAAPEPGPAPEELTDFFGPIGSFLIESEQPAHAWLCSREPGNPLRLEDLAF